jgi:hypothetical protein
MKYRMYSNNHNQNHYQKTNVGGTMIIKNSEGQEIYNKRSNGNLDTDSIINAIVKAGGVDKIHVKLFDNGFTMNEFINSVRFLKSINFDINQLPIEQYKEYGGIELIKQGYNMYKLVKTISQLLPNVVMRF